MSQIVSWDGVQPVSPAVLKEWSIAEVFKPAMVKLAGLAALSKKIRTAGDSFAVPSYQVIPVKSSIAATNELAGFGKSQLVLDGIKIQHVLRGQVMEFTETMVKRNKGLYNILEIGKEQMQQQMARQIDKIHKDAIDAAPIVYTPTGASTAAVATNGTPGSIASNLNVYHLQHLAYLASDRFAIPKISKLGAWALFTRGNAFFSLRQDTRFEAQYQTLSEQSLREFEVLNIAGIKLICSDDEAVLTDNVLNNTTFYAEGVLLGESAQVMGVVDDFGLYSDFGNTAANNYGTKLSLFYKGDVGVGNMVSVPEKRRARIIRIR